MNLGDSNPSNRICERRYKFVCGPVAWTNHAMRSGCSSRRGNVVHSHLASKQNTNIDLPQWQLSSVASADRRPSWPCLLCTLFMVATMTDAACLPGRMRRQIVTDDVFMSNESCFLNL